MRFSKYSESKDNITVGSYSSITQNKNNDGLSYGPPPTASKGDNRNLWGNYDDGGDINDSMKINGNIYINRYSDDDENGNESGEKDEWDVPSVNDDIDWDWDNDEEGGSLYVENNITADTITGNESYGKKLFVNYPYSTSPKANVADLIKNNADNISKNRKDIDNLTITVNDHTNKINNLTDVVNNHTTLITNNTNNIATNRTDIDNLTTTVNGFDERIKDATDKVNELSTKVDNNSTAITNLTTQVSTNTTNISNNSTNISNNTTEINNIKNSLITEERVKELIQQLAPSVNTDGDASNPVILISGRLYRNATNNGYWFSGTKKPYITFTTTVNEGLMTINLSTINNQTINISSVVANQNMSGKANDLDTTKIGARGVGAHWIQSNWYQNYIYIREFRQANGNNDSWASDNWLSSEGISAVNIIVCGHLS